MKPRLLTRLFAGAGVAGIVLAFCAMQPVARAQTTGVNVSLPTLVTTASAGTSGTLALDGKYSNCTVTTVTSTSTATVTVYGNYVTGQYGPAAPNLANGNFGSSGAITATTTTAYTAGNVANLPIGLFYTWSGNSGTLTVQAVCSSAIAKAASGSAGPSGPPGPSGAPGTTGPSGPPGSSAPTICPSAGALIAITGSFPCSVAVSPAPTATSTSTAGPPQCTFAGLALTCDFPVAGGAAPSFSASPPVTVATPIGQVNIAMPYQTPCLGVVSGQLAVTCACAVASVASGCSRVSHGFPWVLRQSNTFCSTGTATSTMDCTFATSPTSGDFLLAYAAYSCNASGTITTPTGWTIVEGPVCNSPVGLIVYDKTAAGTETTVAFVQSNSSGISGGMFDFSGARTVDKVAENDLSLSVALMPSLTSPTAGAAVLVFCAALSSSSGVTDIKFSPADVINDWMFAYTPTASSWSAGTAYGRTRLVAQPFTIHTARKRHPPRAQS